MNLNKILFATIVSFGLVACGGGSDDTSTDSNPEPTTTVETPSSNACAVDGETISAPSSGEVCNYETHTVQCLEDGRVKVDGIMTAQTVTINSLSFICDK